MLFVRILAVGMLSILHPLSQAEAGIESPAGVEATSVQLSSSTERSREGFLTLSWQSGQPRPPGSDSERTYLRVSADRSFASSAHDIRLRGQAQVHLSGFDDGTYFARLTDGERKVLSNTVSFLVQHRDLHTAWGLFGAGLFMFTLLLIAIVHFTRQEP